MAGAGAVQRSILKDFPKADISVSVVWIDMLPADNAESARRSAKIVDDPRVRHFHDPRESRLAGKAFEKRLIKPGAGPAWDIYLFYDRTAKWESEPPTPTEYLHQLSGGQRADPKHFRTGDQLVSGLYEAMKRLVNE